MHTHLIVKSTVLSVFLFFSSTFTSITVSAVELSTLFSDHMVIQREKPILINGKAKIDELITVKLANHSTSTRTDINGQWKVTLPKLPAGGPFTLKIVGEKLTKTLKDVYIGDVWLASGQSNMDFKLSWGINNWQEEVKNSNLPLIRFFDVQDNIQTKEQNTLTEGEWKIASPENSPNFSATAWFFAKHLHKDKNIPVGIIDSTWGGTPAEAWTPLNILQTLNGYKQAANSVLDNPKVWDRKIADSKQQQHIKQQMLFNSNKRELLGLSDLSYDDSQWKKIDVSSRNTNPNINWLRKHFTINELPTNPSSIKIDLGSYPKIVWVYLNGQLVGHKTADQQPKIFELNLSSLQQDVLKQGKNVLALRAANSWDNKVRFGSKPAHMALTYTSEGNKSQTVNLDGTWLLNNTIEGTVPKPVAIYQKEGVLFNGMINPLINTPLTGVIWYQGEGNIKRSSEYAELFQSMIISWRDKWQQQNLPFVFAQLASMHAPQPTPMDSTWAKLREAQTQTLSLPNTAMAVLIDAGEAFDIHPRNKQIVGERLFHAANQLVYGSNKLGTGPMAVSLNASTFNANNALAISFKDVGEGLFIKSETPKTLKGFEIAGSDGVYVNANASIVGNSIKVYSNLITSPKSVRYGWADNSLANLYNKNGFPAVPFRLGENIQ